MRLTDLEERMERMPSVGTEDFFLSNINDMIYFKLKREGKFFLSYYYKRQLYNFSTTNLLNHVKGWKPFSKLYISFSEVFWSQIFTIFTKIIENASELLFLLYLPIFTYEKLKLQKFIY